MNILEYLSIHLLQQQNLDGKAPSYFIIEFVSKLKGKKKKIGLFTKKHALKLAPNKIPLKGKQI